MPIALKLRYFYYLKSLQSIKISVTIISEKGLYGIFGAITKAIILQKKNYLPLVTN